MVVFNCMCNTKEFFFYCLYVFYMDLRTTTTFPLYNINRLDFITEAESVYFAVRTESFYN